MQYYCEVDSLFDVPPESFNPAPKVDSAIVRLTPRASSDFKEVPFAALEKLVAMAFSMRRKTLANNLKPVMNATELQTINMDPGMRPEQMTVAQYATITRHLLDKGRL